MPATVKAVGRGRFQVRTPNQVHARATTRSKAMAQQRLLNGIEHSPKFAAKIKSENKSKKRKKRKFVHTNNR